MKRETFARLFFLILLFLLTEFLIIFTTKHLILSKGKYDVQNSNGSYKVKEFREISKKSKGVITRKKKTKKNIDSRYKEWIKRLPEGISPTKYLCVVKIVDQKNYVFKKDF